MPRQWTDTDLSALAGDDSTAFSEFLNEPPPEFTPVPPSPSPDGWRPNLNPTQLLAYDDPTENILLDGEKASGKSCAGIFKLVRHCYEVQALALIIVTRYNTGDLGIWDDLQKLALPAFAEGNRYPEGYIDETGYHVHPHAGELMDTGMGLEYTESRLDPKTKASKIWIRNRFGTASLVVLLSIPFSAQIEARVKGPAPSFVLVEELTNCESMAYFSYLSAQLGRRRGLGGAAQQFVASCNPAGPSHWVYDLWFRQALAPAPPLGNGRLNLDGFTRKPSFVRYHVPLTENLHRLPPGYMQRLMDAFPDPVDRARMLEGHWVDRPTGRAIYGDYWVPAIHVRGNALTGAGIRPKAGVPIIVSMDPGPVNFSIHFEQLVASTDKGLLLVIFDELNFVGQYMPYHKVIPAIMRRMAYWQSEFGPFSFEFVSDEASFNQVRSDGKFDYQEIERLSHKWVTEHPESKVPAIKLKACPKGNDSVPARTRMMIGMMQQETLLVSATCPKTIEMFAMLESEDEKLDKSGVARKYDPLAAFRPKRSIFVHPNDSVSYGAFYFTATNARYAVPQTNLHKVYECGSG